MGTAIFIIVALFASFLFIINPTLVIIVGGGVVLILWLIYDVVKSAVKQPSESTKRKKLNRRNNFDSYDD